MSLSKEALKNLVALQERDKALDGLEEAMRGIPDKIDAVKAEIEAEKAKLSGAKAAVTSLEKKKKEKELELAQKEEAALKHSRELNAVKTNEAFKALQAEIEKAKAEAGGIETEILEIMEGIDEARRAEKASASDIAGVEKGLRDKIAVLEKEQTEVKARFEAAKAERDAAAAGVDAELVKIYTHIRTRGKLNAVVPAEAQHCGACRIALAPQVIVELTRVKDVVLCESCQRILYRPQSLAASGAPASGAQSV